MKQIIIIIFAFFTLTLNAQYLEDFTYVDGTTFSITWTTDCSDCSLGSGDYFHVLNNELRGRDLDGIAIFETTWIDISSYSNITFSGDISKQGDMEGINTTVSVHHDFVDVEYNINNSGWVDIKDYLNHGISDSTFYGEDGGSIDSGNDDEWNGETLQTFYRYGLSGDSIKIKISLRNSANSEIWGIDNISLTEESLLPVELLKFDAKVLLDYNYLKWTTLSEVNNKGFEVLKSEDAINWEIIGWVDGEGTTFEQQEYNFIDESISINNYYKLNQIDWSDESEESKIIYVKRDVSEVNNIIYFDITGKKVNNPTISGTYIKYNTYTNKGSKIIIY